VTRIFAGTPWDRPPRCDRCGRLETDCACPPAAVEPPPLPPHLPTAILRREKRPRGKVVTIVAGLDPPTAALEALAAQLKSACGTGGTIKQGRIELQGDRLEVVDRLLQGMGYTTRRK
jgi:translation initiation factor 1